VIVTERRVVYRSALPAQSSARISSSIGSA
jgi:hypothetical protein